MIFYNAANTKFNGDFVPRVGYGWKVFDRRAEKYDNGTKSWFAEPGRIADCPKQVIDFFMVNDILLPSFICSHAFFKNVRHQLVFAIKKN